jgi:WD40 repeat protein
MSISARTPLLRFLSNVVAGSPTGRKRLEQRHRRSQPGEATAFALLVRTPRRTAVVRQQALTALAALLCLNTLVGLLVGYAPAPAPRTDRAGFPLPDEALARVGLAISERPMTLNELLANPPDLGGEPAPSMHFSCADQVLELWDGAILAVDWQTGRILRRVEVPHGDANRRTVLAPDLSRAAIKRAGKVHLWDVTSGRELCAIPTFSDNSVFFPDGKTLYTEWADRAEVWDVDSGTRLAAFDRNRHLTHQLTISPDGRWLAATAMSMGLMDSGGAQGGSLIAVWNAASGDAVQEFRPLGRASIGAIAFSPDGNSLVAVGDEVPAWTSNRGPGLFELWDIRTGEEKLLRNGLAAHLICAAFSPDGRVLATGDTSHGVRLWELATGQDRHCFTGHRKSVGNVVFSSDGRLLASGDLTASVFVWDVEGNFGRRPLNTPFSDGEKQSLWKSLDDADASAAFTTMRRLLARPGPTVALLRDSLRLAIGVDEKAVQPLLRKLESAPFDALDKAVADLAAIIDPAEPLVRKALTQSHSAESRRRIQNVLESAGTGAPGRRRQVRAVEVAEHLGTPEARELLKTWASGAEGVLLTQEARASLQRQSRR